MSDKYRRSRELRDGDKQWLIPTREFLAGERVYNVHTVLVGWGSYGKSPGAIGMVTASLRRFCTECGFVNVGRWQRICEWLCFLPRHCPKCDKASNF